MFIVVLALINLFNLIDLISTYYHVMVTQTCVELNPLMNLFLGFGLAWFISFKLLGAVIATYIFYIGRELPLARRTLYIITILYGALCIWHSIIFFSSPNTL